uniref:Uncharacterized protein n=1 Tax=Oryza brachyantha TaxID=4533 RepID=J3MRC5_ORYBR
MAAPQKNNQAAAPVPRRPPPLPQPPMAHFPRRLEHEISRMDSCIRELEDESRHGSESDEGRYASLKTRRRIEKVKAMKAQLISRYLQYQQKHDDGDDDGDDAPPPPPAAGGAAAVN